MAGSKNPLFNTATTLGKVVAFVVVAAVCGVLTAGLMVPLTSAIGAGTAASIQTFEDLPSELVGDAPFQQTQVLDREGGLIATLGTNRKVVPLDQISKTMQDALLAIEDARFYEHGGVDIRGVGAAIYGALQGDSLRGASTITQQYVNNVIINDRIQAGEDAGYAVRKTIGDKIKEARLAIAVEKKMSKEEILAGYLNIVPFAGDAYGIEAGANYYFGVSAKDLNVPQSAMLAGIVNGIGAYDPIQYPEAAKERRNLVLKAMLDQGKIDQKTYDESVASDLGLNVQPPKKECFAAVQAGYFCQYVRALIEGDPQYGETLEDRKKFLSQGLTIKTTLDPVAQAAAQNRLNEAANPDPALTDPSMAAGMVSVQPGTGDVLVMAQSTRYDGQDQPGSSQINLMIPQYKDGDPNWPLSETSNGLAPGSSFKPYVLQTWLEAGRGLNERLDARDKDYPVGTPFPASCLPDGNYYIGGETYKPRNYNLRPYTVESALNGLKASLNTVTIAEAKQLDLCAIFQNAAEAGATQATWNKDTAPEYGTAPAGTPESLLTKPMPVALPNVLGSANTSPLGQATGFATYAAEGLKCEPRAILEIKDKTGKSYPVAEPKCEQVIDKNVAIGVKYALSQTMTPGGSAAAYYIPNAGGKTGTTESRENTWFVGITSGIATATWMGSIDNTKWSADMGTPKQIGGRVYQEADGGSTALPIWNAYMNDIAGRYPADPFPYPSPEIMNGRNPNNFQLPQPPQPAPSNPPGDGGGNGGDNNGNNGNNGGGNGNGNGNNDG